MINSFMLKINDTFLKKTLSIIIPVALQNLIFSSLNLVDTLMIGQLGETSIAGVSFANQYFFVLTLLFFGITGGSSIFTSQFWGTKNIEKIKHILGTAIKIVFFSGLVFTLVGLLFPRFVISIFTKEADVIEVGSKYLKIVSICYIFSGLSYIFTGVLRSIGHVKLPTIVSLISLSLNTFLNYVLIFGKFGFPQLGVQGAAIATITSRILEFILIITILKIRNNPLTHLKKYHFKLVGDLRNRYYKTLIPVVTNETMWAVGAAAYTAIYGRISTDSAVAYQIQQTITTMFLIFVFGTGNASGILIGNKIGEGSKEEAYDYGKKFIKLSLVVGLITGLVIIIASPYLIPLFKVKSSVIVTSRTLIHIFAAILVFKSLNITMVVGVLRGGGDTKVAMLMDILGVWGIGIPLGLFAAFVLKMPIQLVYPLICVEEIIKGVYGIYRFKSKKWINNLTIGE